MTIDWQAFTPGASLTGGVLIGVAVSIFVLFNGRVAGISGIVGGLCHPIKGDVAWRASFIVGLVVAPLASMVFVSVPRPHIDASYDALVVAGMLVGFGTRYGSGCTSGHGVCGLARHSPRSLLATAVFMAAGLVTVYLIRHG